jgi:hypothetical protein
VMLTLQRTRSCHTLPQAAPVTAACPAGLPVCLCEHEWPARESPGDITQTTAEGSGLLKENMHQHEQQILRERKQEAAIAAAVGGTGHEGGITWALCCGSCWQLHGAEVD